MFHHGKGRVCLVPGEELAMETHLRRDGLRWGEERLEAGRCWRFLRLPKEDRECLRDLGILGRQGVASGDRILVVLIAHSWS